ncbi:c-type cytochrome [Neokomagataea thailandica]|uniref:Sorbitol dehydrogenase cytochrome c subunit n=1 Tax=Neokomagataea tanensis NBRC 106556 TaxID=1223519 RepID=A0ABQ0QJW2_9PROT|nr:MULTISPECIES: c-type cytochrome [Neokomagataea]GBR47418.1 sorbitol dehydrogenase cytochrome c subunit [Neokomagataea tanensis NBRC 106556]
MKRLTISAAVLLALSVSPAYASDDAAQIARGRYLAIAADCAACHTRPTHDALPYAGGYGISSPLGSIYSTNITPSKKYGIGHYTEEQFKRVLRKGIRADGAYLYPAMPYTSYARLTDKDIQDLYIYFMKGVEPVDKSSPLTHLPFPFNVRVSMWGWNLFFLNAKPFVSDPKNSAEVNRGAYLALALGHCDTCHTPRNALMAEIPSQSMGGAALSSWYAPNITASHTAGIGDWSAHDIALYLKTGDVPGKAQAAGPMAEAIEHSFQYLSASDIAALVAYIQQIPANDHGGPVNSKQRSARDSYGHISYEDSTLRGARLESINKGALLYDGACASCHQPTGIGSKDGYYPQLFHNTATGSVDPSNLVATILNGVDRTIGQKHYFMPGFSQGSYAEHLSDADVAAVSNYVLSRFGNSNAMLTEDDVTRIRHGGAKPLIAEIGPYITPALLVAGGFMVAVIGVFLRKRRS